MLKWLDPSKITKSKFSGLLLIAFIAGLYFIQNRAVVPFVEAVAESDAFMEENGDEVDKDRTPMALIHCNDFVRNELNASSIVEFGAKDYKSWELAKGRYLISSSVVEQDGGGRQVKKNFACNVQYRGGDEADQNNWTLEGLEIRDL